jgi:hypothetical protein
MISSNTLVTLLAVTLGSGVASIQFVRWSTISGRCLSHPTFGITVSSI